MILDLLNVHFTPGMLKAAWDARITNFADLAKTISSAASSTNSFYYMARAVNAGRFRVGAIGAEAMYDPEFRSYHGARWLSILPR